jgi:transcription-repair coupling factor (superfamily II helicase)
MSLPEFILQTVLDHPALRRASETTGPGRRASLAGLVRPAKGFAAAALSVLTGRTALVLTSDNEAADRHRQNAAAFLAWMGCGDPAAASVLPAFDATPYQSRSPHPAILERRAVTLWNLACGRVRALFVPLPAALGRFRDAAFYRSLALELEPGNELALPDLAEHLEGIGYERAEPVAETGQFSIRGGIVDVFPPETEWPYRLEFFGDRIESLRQYDPATQRSRGPAQRAVLLPLTEFRVSARFFDNLVTELIRRAPGREGREPSWAAEHSAPFPGWEFYAPLVESHAKTLFDLVPQPVVIWDEPLERCAQARELRESWASGWDECRDASPRRPEPGEVFLGEGEFNKALGSLPSFSLRELEVEPASASSAMPGPEEASSAPPEVTFPVPTQSVPKFHGAVRTLVDDLRQRVSRGEQLVLVLSAAGKLDRLREILSEYELPFSTGEDGAQTSVPPGEDGAKEGRIKPLLLVRGALDEGFHLADLNLTFLSDRDLFGEVAWGSPGRRERSAAASFISDLSDLKVGDYVVHVDHGIGIYQGLRPLEVDGARRDFMLLTYSDDARLYVPLERLDLIEKYRASGDGPKPPLDRLGGTAWVKTKTRVRRALRDIAQELLRLYAERKTSGGTSFSRDTPWQKEFEETFEFEETPDQVRALGEIKGDLESPEPMDRLLCGDVGYGKTELAMRAAFKAIQDGKQVAVLAPTTVLAFQHYNTFRQRMAAFPVRIEMLSRFVAASEQKKIVADAEAGKVDILIGTHRLLSKDVRLRDLGLLIVDEEQRFGVAAKERLKKLRASVDVLTMSATPIPRTLHMSLGGLRDLSVIETPPRGRLAIQTVVAPFSDALIQSAIFQELNREGQVYFVHNRVETIWSLASLIQRLVPTARLGVAHGQLGERELERVMLKFIRGEYDVLVSTAIIENGLDIPRANTLIVNRADRFGLADLYQLRGRVGRSDRRAYAYFLIPSEDTLTPTAKRRLAALKEFSDLGAGFRLAALDLELRGAGNLLGAEQSGHLHAIGIDLYLKMLEETVQELKGAPRRPEVRTTLNLGLDIKIPESYIADEAQRLRMYKRISSLESREARGALEVEMEDRFGPLPDSVANLLEYALLKSEAERLLVHSIERKADEVLIRFHPEAPVSPEKLLHYVRQHRQASFRPQGVLRFRLPPGNGGLPRQIENVLREIRASN